jgi:16S rRNA processing protein RimM
MSDGKDWIEIGVVTKPHGVKGAVKVHLHNPETSLQLTQVADLRICQPVQRRSGTQPVHRRSGTQPEQRRSGTQPEQRRSGTQPEQRRSGTQPEQRRSGTQPEQRRSGTQPEQRRSGTQPEQRRSGTQPEQRRSGTQPEQRRSGTQPEQRRSGTQPEQPEQRRSGTQPRNVWAVRCLARQGDDLIVACDRIQSRDVAEQLRGATLEVPRDDVEINDDEFFYVDLIGCRVVEGDRQLGEVVEVFFAGASDVLVVHDETHERMIPLVDDWVADVDLQARAISVINADQFEPSPRTK